MTNNFYTLSAQARFLNECLNGCAIESIFTQDKGKFVISIGGCESGNAVEFSSLKDMPYLILRKNYAKASKNTAEIFSEAGSQNVSAISIFGGDRAIEMKLSDGTGLLFTFFASPNCFHVKDGTVISAFKDSKAHTGRRAEDLLKRKADDAQDIVHSKTAQEFLKDRYPNLGEVYRREVLFRCRADQPSETENDAGQISKVADELLIEVSRGNCLYYVSEGKPVMSLCRLEHLMIEPSGVFDDVNGLMVHYVISRLRSDRENMLRKSARTRLERSLAESERRFRSIEEQIRQCSDADTFRRSGELILANIHQIRKGMTKLTADGESGEPVEIRLKPGISPAMNANHYFEKAKKQKASVGLLRKKSDLLLKEIGRIKSDITMLGESGNLKTLEKEFKMEKKMESDETSSFRKFTVEGGLEVWVGKDSASNDLLTTRHSAQNDLWFHVRGTSGSHTVLKTGASKDKIPKEAVISAAAIAAYYSKARNAGNVPVAYCEKKYVKKKKGLSQGAVIMEREKVVFVKPGLPEGNL